MKWRRILVAASVIAFVSSFAMADHGNHDNPGWPATDPRPPLEEDSNVDEPGNSNKRPTVKNWTESRSLLTGTLIDMFDRAFGVLLKGGDNKARR